MSDNFKKTNRPQAQRPQLRLVYGGKHENLSFLAPGERRSDPFLRHHFLERHSDSTSLSESGPGTSNLQLGLWDGEDNDE